MVGQMCSKSGRWGSNYELGCWERTGTEMSSIVSFPELCTVIVIKEKVAKRYGREWVWFGVVTHRNVLVSLGCYNITTDGLAYIETSHLWILSHQRSGWCLMVSGLCLMRTFFIFWIVVFLLYSCILERKETLVNFLLL